MADPMIPPAAAPDFLSRVGWDGAEILPLAGDASFRRYFRVMAPGRQAVLMDAPPPHEDPRPFIRIAEHLTRLGFSAPTILGSDLEHGLVLLEDFGDARMREVVSCERSDVMHEEPLEHELVLEASEQRVVLRPPHGHEATS